MTNEDAQRAFEDLHRLVAESPLAWVLPNVDDEIGKAADEDVTAPSNDDEFEDTEDLEASENAEDVEE